MKIELDYADRLSDQMFGEPLSTRCQRISYLQTTASFMFMETNENKLGSDGSNNPPSIFGLEVSVSKSLVNNMML